jgi:dihydroneopterin aldolase
MSKTNLPCELHIHSIELNLNLGWRSKDRSLEQAILLDMDIRFPAPPQACITDNLDDTICYAKLIEEIREKTSAKQYKLLEHLSADIYHLAKKHMPHDASITVRITKYPQIAGLKNGVSFEYGDKQ